MYNRSTLKNGLRIVTAELPHTRSATVSFYVGAGSRYEIDEEAGLSHFLEHMLFKGASRRPTAREVPRRSNPSAACTTPRPIAKSPSITPRSRTPPSSKRSTCSPIWFCSPIMDPAELEKERNVILEELASVEDSPGELAGILIDETLWPNQPLGRNIGGTPESVKSLPLTSVNRYLADQYVPGNMVLAVAGNIEHEKIVESANKWLGDWVERAPGPWVPITARARIRPASLSVKRNRAGPHLHRLRNRARPAPGSLCGRPPQRAAGRWHVEPPLPRTPRRAGPRLRHPYLPERISRHRFVHHLRWVRPETRARRRR